MSKGQMPDFQATIGCVVTALINRCKANPKYYPRNFLLQIVENRDLSYRWWWFSMFFYCKEWLIVIIIIIIFSGNPVLYIPSWITRIYYQSFLSLFSDEADTSQMDFCVKQVQYFSVSCWCSFQWVWTMQRILFIFLQLMSRFNGCCFGEKRSASLTNLLTTVSRYSGRNYLCLLESVFKVSWNQSIWVFSPPS